MDDDDYVPSPPLSPSAQAQYIAADEDRPPIRFLVPIAFSEESDDPETTTEISFVSLFDFVDGGDDLQEDRVQDKTLTSLNFNAVINFSGDDSEADSADAPSRARSNIVAVPVTRTEEGDLVHVAPPVIDLEPIDYSQNNDDNALKRMRTGELFDLWLTTFAIRDDGGSDGNTDESSELTYYNPQIFVARNVRFVNGPGSVTACPPYVYPYTRTIAGVTTDRTPDEIMDDMQQYLFVAPEPGTATAARATAAVAAESEEDNDDDKDDGDSSSDSDLSNPAPGVHDEGSDYDA